MTEQELKQKAIHYLKTVYGEDTVSMDVTGNTVEDQNGVLSVDCTVSVDGRHSDWSKKFTFRNGDVVTMTWRRR